MPSKRKSKPKNKKTSEPTEDLYIATKKFKDWESGWNFNPTDPSNNSPKPIEHMTKGLKGAIKRGIVVKVEGKAVEPEDEPEDEPEESPEDETPKDE